MPRISEEKIKKIEEQIIFYLYSIFPKQVFTSHIAKELARDEEFMKKRLIELHKKGIIIKVNKNPKGIQYEKRIRWRISSKAHLVYQEMQ